MALKLPKRLRRADIQGIWVPDQRRVFRVL